MLLDLEVAQAVIARLDDDPAGRSAWAASRLGFDRPAPYVRGRSGLPAGSRVEFRAVGGVGLARRDAAFSAAVADALASAHGATVRERRTQGALAALGIQVGLSPDPVTALVGWLRQTTAGPAPIAGPYVAVQCAASFGDDESLAALAAGLDALGQPVVLFRAGAAPWHDDLSVYGRLAARLAVPVHIFDRLHVADICRLVAGARACVASSLHALLVAGLAGVPALGLERRAGEGDKLRAYAETWGGFTVTTLNQNGALWRSQLCL